MFFVCERSHFSAIFQRIPVDGDLFQLPDGLKILVGILGSLVWIGFCVFCCWSPSIRLLSVLIYDKQIRKVAKAKKNCS